MQLVLDDKQMDLLSEMNYEVETRMENFNASNPTATQEEKNQALRDIVNELSDKIEEQKSLIDKMNRADALLDELDKYLKKEEKLKEEKEEKQKEEKEEKQKEVKEENK